MKKIMFVCTGNICRSPVAEAILRKLSQDFGHKIEVISSGLEAQYHAGEKPDYRAMDVMHRRGLSSEGLISTQFTKEHFEECDLILAMSPKHKSKLLAHSKPEHQHKIHLLLEYVELGTEVEDPYYKPQESFDEMFEILHTACTKLLQKLKP